MVEDCFIDLLSLLAIEHIAPIATTRAHFMYISGLIHRKRMFFFEKVVGGFAESIDDRLGFVANLRPNQGATSPSGPSPASPPEPRRPSPPAAAALSIAAQLLQTCGQPRLVQPSPAVPRPQSLAAVPVLSPRSQRRPAPLPWPVRPPPWPEIEGEPDLSQCGLGLLQLRRRRLPLPAGASLGLPPSAATACRRHARRRAIAGSALAPTARGFYAILHLVATVGNMYVWEVTSELIVQGSNPFAEIEYRFRCVFRQNSSTERGFDSDFIRRSLMP
uniref:Uncharacterized protein n=1 Tax=Ananas comosus var. bracteatus TaxID=296719 RepID=A0A6V7PPW6_ANACO|nr:unnamed protein product [Ananas comosus var. bracteatus]